MRLTILLFVILLGIFPRVVGIRTLTLEDQAILVSRKELLTPAGPRR